MKAKLSEQTGRSKPKANMKEITFNVERDEENGWLTASWDAPSGQGGIKHSGKRFARVGTERARGSPLPL